MNIDYVIEFTDDNGREENIDLSPFVISPFSSHMMQSISGRRHMLTRTSRPRRELFSNPNPLEVMGIALGRAPKPARSRISTFKAEGDLGECSICQEQIKKGQMMCRLPCQDTVSHAFHRECIMPWLEKNDTCPNCRSKI